MTDSEKYLKEQGLDIFCFVQDHKVPRNHHYVKDLLDKYALTKAENLRQPVLSALNLAGK